ncbi:putative uncharacterized protein DDB_G0290521 [Paralichthys olivaceus]|uniref:putative uncharacterized protein DDB_G0290521 n=1 Tax=Paralichthys olivaceus TaxID=8255 RepID=UPI003753E6B0
MYYGSISNMGKNCAWTIVQEPNPDSLRLILRMVTTPTHISSPNPKPSPLSSTGSSPCSSPLSSPCSSPLSSTGSSPSSGSSHFNADCPRPRKRKNTLPSETSGSVPKKNCVRTIVEEPNPNWPDSVRRILRMVPTPTQISSPKPKPSPSSSPLSSTGSSHCSSPCSSSLSSTSSSPCSSPCSSPLSSTGSSPLSSTGSSPCSSPLSSTGSSPLSSTGSSPSSGSSHFNADCPRPRKRKNTLPSETSGSVPKKNCVWTIVQEPNPNQPDSVRLILRMVPTPTHISSP